VINEDLYVVNNVSRIKCAKQNRIERVWRHTQLSKRCVHRNVVSEQQKRYSNKQATTHYIHARSTHVCHWFCGCLLNFPKFKYSLAAPHCIQAASSSVTAYNAIRNAIPKDQQQPLALQPKLANK
jgi:hypothetical protein